jgi:hypothetical protein
VFVQRGGKGGFQKYGIADGLHPYGYLNGDMARYMGVPDGSPADKNPSLSATPAISVAGGPGDIAFVGYQGKATCEDNWNWQCNIVDPQTGKCVQATSPSTWGDPSIYKSGDADRVTLSGSGISVYAVWPDKVQEPNVPRPSEQVMDFVSGAAALQDGTVWVGSDARGMAHITAAGIVDRYLTAGPQGPLVDNHIGALATDPDGSVWIGYEYGGGVSRLLPNGTIQNFGYSTLGNLANSQILDIQIQKLPDGRNVLVAFRDGAVGIYSGN